MDSVIKCRMRNSCLRKRKPGLSYFSVPVDTWLFGYMDSHLTCAVHSLRNQRTMLYTGQSLVQWSFLSPLPGPFHIAVNWTNQWAQVDKILTRMVYYSKSKKKMLYLLSSCFQSKVLKRSMKTPAYSISWTLELVDFRIEKLIIFAIITATEGVWLQ